MSSRNSLKKQETFYLKSLGNNLTSKPVDFVNIGKRKVGSGYPCFIIAEVGNNHKGKLENALKFIDAAKEAGADAVKFQHIKAETIAAKTLRDFYKSAELPYKWTGELIAHANLRNIIFLSTPFDFEAVDVLDRAGTPAFKVASYELTFDPLLTHIAEKGKPIILSTGMAYLEEVAHAVRIIQKEGNNQIILLHCVSLYPPESFADLNLKAILVLQQAFKLPVGFSDHSRPPYLAAAITAVALGACVIEKHVTFNRKGGSNDDPNSLEISEFQRMVREIRNCEEALRDSGIKQPVSRPPHHRNDEVSDRYYRRSIWTGKNIPAGTVITPELLTVLRPEEGIPPTYFSLLTGKRAKRDIKAGEPIKWEDLT